jgi:nicotinamidase-related amidase
MSTIPDANPYPWPYDGRIDPAATALVVCGAQTGLRALAPTAPAVLATLTDLASALRPLGVLVVWVRHGAHGARRPTPLPAVGTDEWALCTEPAPGDLVIDAAGWDGGFGSTLDHELRRHGRTHLVLGGLASELTVDTTVRTLNDQGYECLVLTDGCAPVDADLGARAHHSLTMSGGIFGALAPVAALRAALAASPNPPPTPLANPTPSPETQETS